MVYAKTPFGGPEHVLHYLARYTHRVAISNHRLIALRRQGHLPLEGLRPRQQEAQDDAHRRRVHPAVPVARAAPGFRAHPLLWLPGQPATAERSWLNANSSWLALPETRSRPSPAQPTSNLAVSICGGTMVVIERLTAQQVADRTTEPPGYVDTS